MDMSRKTVAGVVSLIALAALGTAVNPASAGRPAQAPAAAPGAAADSCVGWKNAGSAPLKWTKASDACGHFGAEGMKMGYAWKVYRGGSICIRAKGFDARRKEFWSDPLCGKSGSLKIHWGNVAATKEIQVKGGPSLLRWN
ncbi:hypothetical protein OG259_33475 [Streptomyces sp. NBC_00250]|uniref:hypothetical protein n=1 Tax=Streptomyces sp. NBC_00250 TaxID=2903641 RepID=UPI002E294B97|nr:hypothetical protein [Streptomyces sp. NBC_00250]